MSRFTPTKDVKREGFAEKTKRWWNLLYKDGKEEKRQRGEGQEKENFKERVELKEGERGLMRERKGRGSAIGSLCG